VLLPLYSSQRNSGRRCLIAHCAAKRVEGADAADRNAGAGRQASGRCQPDPDADKGPRPAADGDSAHLPPATACLRGALYLSEQSSRVPGSPIGSQAKRRLVQHLLAANRADRGVGGRRVETDDRLLLGAQLSQ
jgi:hypothetical protein